MSRAEMTECAQHLLTFLQTHPETQYGSLDLAHAIGLRYEDETAKKTIIVMVKELRANLHPISSNSSGYTYTTSSDKLTKAMTMQRKKMNGMRRTLYKLQHMRDAILVKNAADTIKANALATVPSSNKQQ